jgi:hypothetical protein
MSIITQRLGRQLYLPSLHLWYRPIGKAASSSAFRVEIGLTDRGLQDLGDINTIARMKKVDDTVEKGDNLLSMDWDGHFITSADELYHTVWDTISGTYCSLKSPITGKIDYMIDGDDIVDEDEVLVTLSTDENSLEGILASLVTEDEYLKSVEENGAFNQVEGMYR